MNSMTSTQALIGMFWLPTLIVLVVGYQYWKHRKYTRHNSQMPGLNGLEETNDGERHRK